MARPRKKRRTHASNDATARTTSGGRPPKSMVVRMGAGEVGASGSQLAQDFRRMMEPDTASRLKERKGNKLKDYTAMAGPLGVTHLFLFSRSDASNTHLRIALTPRGPTLTFRVERYTLSKDVAKTQKHPRTGAQDHMTPPLLVMNNFTTPTAQGQTQDPVQKQLESLTTTIFQSMFPAISPQSTPLTSIRRILLLNREPKLQSAENGTYVLSLRHYSISTRSAGISRRVRRFDPTSQRAHERKTGPLPNLGRLEDAADYLLDPASGGYTSASETELDTDAEVEVLETPTQHVFNKKQAQKDGQTNGITTHPEANGNIEKRSVKLTELGPRMQLRLIKVEEGICEGKVMWNEFIKKTKAEAADLDEKWEHRRQEKEERRAIQRENVERKRKEREATKPKGGNTEGEEDQEESEMEWDSDEIEAELERHADGDIRLENSGDDTSGRSELESDGFGGSKEESEHGSEEGEDEKHIARDIAGVSKTNGKLAGNTNGVNMDASSKKRKLTVSNHAGGASEIDHESDEGPFAYVQKSLEPTTVQTDGPTDPRIQDPDSEWEGFHDSTEEIPEPTSDNTTPSRSMAEEQLLTELAEAASSVKHDSESENVYDSDYFIKAEAVRNVDSDVEDSSSAHNMRKL